MLLALLYFFAKYCCWVTLGKVLPCQLNNTHIETKFRLAYTLLMHVFFLNWNFSNLSLLDLVVRFDLASTIGQGTSNLMSHLIPLFWFSLTQFTHYLISSQVLEYHLPLLFAWICFENRSMSQLYNWDISNIHSNIIEAWILSCSCQVISAYFISEQPHIPTSYSKDGAQCQYTRITRHCPWKLILKGRHSRHTHMA